MSREKTRRQAVERLWKLIVSNPPPTEDVRVCEEYYTWLVDRLAEDPDFQALVNATARRKLQSRPRGDQ